MQKFLRTLTLVALLVVPWVSQAQNAKVSEYDYSVSTQVYGSIASTGTAWTATDMEAGYVDIAMPFDMQFGELTISEAETLRVSKDGYATFTGTGHEGTLIVPLQYSTGYTAKATSVYYKASTTNVTVEWRKVTSGSNSYSFQMKLYPSGDIEFCYGPMTLNSNISVFTGLQTSSSDIFRATGESSPNDWNSLARATTSGTRTLGSSLYPSYNTSTHVGVMYTFTKPACVKPSGINATADSWDAVTVDWTVANNGTKYEIAYSETEGFDADAATGVTRVTITDGTAESYQITGLHGQHTYYFAVRTYCGNTPSGWLYRSTGITTPAACSLPTSYTYMLLSADGVVTWNLSNYTTVSSVDLYYSTENVAPAADAEPKISGTLAEMESVDLMARQDIAAISNTTWYVWCRYNCTLDGGATSAWYGSRNFKTPCAALTAADLPYTMDFEDNSFDCWNKLQTYSSYPSITSSYNHTDNGSKALSMGIYGSSNKNIIASQAVPLAGNNIYVSFWYRTNNSSYLTLEAGVMTDLENMTTFQPLTTVYGTNNTYVKGEFNTAELDADETYYVVFRLNNSSSWSTYYAYLDDITIKAIPTCMAPSTPVQEGLTTTSATVSWTGTAASYVIEARQGDDVIACTTSTTTTPTVEGLTYGEDYDIYVSFWYRTNNSSYLTLEAGVMTDLENMTTFQPLTTVYGTNNTYVKGEFNTAELDADETYYVVFRLNNSSSWSTYYAYLDDITIKAIPTCPEPTGLAVTDDGVATWPASTNASSYKVCYGVHPYTANDADAITFVSGNTLPNLEGQTTYDVYLRAVCATTNEESEEWYGPVTFTTPCPAIAVTPNQPFSMNFDGVSSLPDCWSQQYVSSSHNWNFDGTQAVFAHVAKNDKTKLVTPVLNFSAGVYQLTFSHMQKDWGGDQDKLRIYYRTSSAEEWQLLVEYTSNITSMTPEEIILPNTNATYQIAFEAEDQYGYNVYLDDIAINVMPTCIKPSALAATPAANSAVLSWQENSSPVAATQWEVRYWKAGDEAHAVSVVANSNVNFALNYLDMATTYHWQVRSLCSAEDVSDWSDVSNFNTEACLTITPGEDITMGESTSTNSYLPYYAYYNYSISEQIYTATELGGAATTLNSLSYEVTSSTPSRNVVIYIGHTSKSSFSSVSDAISLSSLTQVYSGTMDGSNGWHTITFTTPFQYDGESNIVVVVDRPYTSWASAGNFGVISTTSNQALYAYDDDLDLTPENVSTIYNKGVLSVKNNFKFGTITCDQGTCVPPTVAISLGPDDNNAKADLIFSGDETQFGYICVAQGTTPNIANGVTVTGNTATITSLTPETAYDLYVYSICENTPGRMVRYGFTTPFVPRCKPQTNFATSDVTYTGATVTWQQEDPTQEPESWMLRWSTEDFDPDNLGATYNTETIAGAATGSFTFSGLHNGDHVYMYTKATCNANDASVNWSSYHFQLPVIEAPANLASWHTTNISDSLTWTEATEGINSWTVAYATADFDPTDPTAVYETLAATNDSVKLTDLEPNTTYYVFVRANSGDEHSAWSAQHTFSTLCPDREESEADGSVTYTMVSGTNPDLTLTEHGAIIYDDGGPNGNYSSYQNQSLTIYPSTPSNMVHLYDPSANTEGSTYDYLIAYNGVGTSGAVLGEIRGENVSFDVTSTDATGAITLYFRSDSGVEKSGWAIQATEIGPCQNVSCIPPATVAAEISNTNEVTLTWTTAENLLPVPTTFEVRYDVAGTAFENCANSITDLTSKTATFSQNLEAETDYVVYVASKCGEGDYSTPRKATFTTYPSCWKPLTLRASTEVAPTTTSVALTWDNPEVPANRWEVAYAKANDDNFTVLPSVTSHENVPVEGLSHSTAYKFRVRAVCDVDAEDYSEWTDAITVRTACGPWTLEELTAQPIVENFDSYNTSVVPACWDRLGTTSYFQTSSSQHKSGNRSLYIYRSTGHYGILPELAEDVNVSNLTLDFSAYFTGSNATTTGLHIGVMTDKTDATTFDTVATIYPTATSTWEDFTVSLEEYTGNGKYVAFLDNNSNGYGYIDDVTLKVTEHTNLLATTSATLDICNEYVMPDTTGRNGNYADGLNNVTYVIRPLEAGKVIELKGDYDLEYGYDSLRLYRGATASADNLIATYTGSGSIHYKTASFNWADSGAVTLVLSTDGDNGLDHYGFKLMASCECPEAVIEEQPMVVETNGTYTWEAPMGNGDTWENHATRARAADLVVEKTYTFTNVAGCDSLTRTLNLMLHPDYRIAYEHTMCERDEYEFYGQTFTTGGEKVVTLQSQYGADSVGVLNLTVNSAPVASIYYNNRVATAINNFCDGFDLNLEVRSNVEGAEYVWNNDETLTGATVTLQPSGEQSYSVVATNPNTGCTSLPSAVTVTTTAVPALTISGDAEVCYGQSATLTLADANDVEATYRWSTGETTTSIIVTPEATTTYSVTATSAIGACQNTAEFTVTVNPLPQVTANATPAVLCQNATINLDATVVDGYTYSWNTGATTAAATVVAAATGNYTVTVTDQKNCVNSFTTNNVTVNPVYDVNDVQSVCYTQNPYTWGTQTLTENGTYNQTFQTVNGCDSVVTLSFTFEQMAVTNSTREVCEGTTVTWGPQTITASESTLLTYTLQSGDVAPDGQTLECPAQYNLALTVNTHNPATVENTVCDSYTWPLTGETLTESGAYQTTLQTVKGCDSLVTLNLTVNYQNTGVDEQTACDTYTWINGETYTASTNEPVHTLRAGNQFGCDSVVTLNLTVNYQSFHTDYHQVCDAKSYTWIDGNNYALDVPESDGVTHTIETLNAAGCDSIFVLSLDLNYVNDTVRRAETVCDEYVIDTVACDNSIETAYLRESGNYMLRTHNSQLNRDEMLLLDLTVNKSSHHTTVATKCLPYTWKVNVGTAEEPDMYEVATIKDDVMKGTDTIISYEMPARYSNGCSNIEVLRLHALRPTVEWSEPEAICQNGSWTDGKHVEHTYNSPVQLQLGENTITWQTGTNNDGCTDEKKIVLTVNPIYAVNKDVTLCENNFTYDSERQLFFDTIVDENHANQKVEVTYTDALNGVQKTLDDVVANWQTTSGCDSTVTFKVTVNPIVTVSTTEQVCYEYTWAANGETYRESQTNLVDSSINATTGCTLVNVLNLTVTGNEVDSISHNVCMSYEYKGVTYTETRTFEETKTGKDGQCDTTVYITYNVHQRALTDQYVYTNKPYPWKNGVEYTASVDKIYYDATTSEDVCDSILVLHLTMAEPVVVCQNTLPYEVKDGDQVLFTIAADKAAGNFEWSNNDAQGNDTVIAYTVNPKYAVTDDPKTVCDSYVWNNQTYTESGTYTFNGHTTKGCDSIATIDLTVNNSTTGVKIVANCDSWTWNEKLVEGVAKVYTESNNTDTIMLTNKAGCDSTVTLNLTINKNAGVEETKVVCDRYEWNGQTLTESNNYTTSFQDANGCTGDSVLHLTVKNTVVADKDSIVNAASTIYLGVLYEAPKDTVINDTVFAGAANGCDSVTRVRLQVNMGAIVQVDTVSCGDFTWMDGNTYTWIPASERTNPIFNYKNRTTNQPVEDYPVYETYDANGIVVNTYVLHLTMAEASVEYKNVTVLLSNVTYTDNGHVFDFTAEKAAKQNATKLDTLHYASSYYCDSIVYYTFNLVYNYVDDDTVTVCNKVATYTTANNAVIALAEGINTFTDTTAAGTDSAMVHNKVYVRSAAITGTETIAACDSVTWNNTLFTANVVDSLVTLTAANGCDSVVTLNITITPTVHKVIDTTVCDSYKWNDKDSTYTVSTTDTWSRANTTDAQCTDVDTLKLVVKHSTTGIDSLVACDTYTWIDNITYTESNNTATKTLTNAAGCDSVVTLNLTVNHSFTGAGRDIDTLGASITLTDKNGSHLFVAPCDSNVTFVYQTVAGCDSTVTFKLKVNQYAIVADNQIQCGLYIWNNEGHGTGHTYKWISDEEKSANAINIPGMSPMLPLYKDETADAYVYSRPMDTVNGTVYMLNLNLNEAEFADSTIARFPQSENILTLHGTDFAFTGLTSATNPAADTVVYLTLPHATLCGTVMKYNVHVVYNYTTDAVTVCYTDTYTWEDSTTSAVTVGSGNTITDTLFAGDWANEQVVTRTITVRANNNTYSFDQEACDSYTWNNETYTVTGSYPQHFTDQYGCDSVATLKLTVKNNTNKTETLTACDSTQWHGTWYYETKLDSSITYSYIATNGCPSVDTLLLTINHNEPQVITPERVCDAYFWDLNNHEYNASGDYTANRTDANNCQAVDTLRLTVGHSTSYDSVFYVTDGSYRYTTNVNALNAGDTTALIMAGHHGSFVEYYTNADSCLHTLKITIYVGDGHFAIDNTTNCNSYTWRDGNTYVWISPEERTANNNALYKNQTTGAYVTSNPVYRKSNENDFDSIYMLRLTLTQNYTEDVTINFPISLDSLVYGDSTFHFGVSNDEGREFVNTTVQREVHFASSYYCDSIHYLTINLQNNYQQDSTADICATQSSYTWRGHTLSTATSDFDHAHTYYIYDTVGTAEAPVVKYLVLTQHPLVYATERRTACDSYTWNGIPFTESTTNYTKVFPGSGVMGEGNFCDSTVTLKLTINHSSSKVTETTVCDSYTWKANNAAQTVIGTYTESVNKGYSYISDEGCPSYDTLRLTVNHNTSTAINAGQVCDKYIWTAENGGDGRVFTYGETYTDADYTYEYNTTEGNCPSVNTLTLTLVKNAGHEVEPVIMCDSYEWHGETYTESGEYYYNYEDANGCASVDTLNLTINVNNGFEQALTTCDSIDWNGHKFYTTGTHTVHYADANGCEADSVLTLTVNHATHNSETKVACQTYEWHGQTYTASSPMEGYTYSYTNDENCTSVDTLHLTINPGRTFGREVVPDHCGPYPWVVNGDTIGIYDENTNTSYSFLNERTQCDSVVYLELTIKNAPVVDTAATVCETTLPYTWRGIEMTEAGVETVTFPLENGCDSTIRFTLTVNPVLATSLTAQVCLGQGYTGNDFNIAASEMPVAGEYTFSHTVPSQVTGCDSTVTLVVTVGDTLINILEPVVACDSYEWTAGDNVVRTLTANGTYRSSEYTNAQGCINIDELALAINTNSSTAYSETVCDGYMWNGTQYTESGDYTYDYNDANGCASTDTLHLTVNNSVINQIERTACDSYTWEDGDGETYTASGIYTYNYTTTENCNGTTYLALTVNRSISVEESATVCDSYEWNGETYTTSGVYTFEGETTAGCDSIATLTLTVNNHDEVAIEASACGFYNWHGQTYDESGEYVWTGTNANGCDSIVTLTLTINQPVATSFEETVCGSYTWNDVEYTVSGNYTQHFSDVNGCDSTVTLNLTVNQPMNTVENIVACDSYLWNDVLHTISGTDSYTFEDANGCTATATLNLTINHSTTAAVSANECSSYTWENGNGQTYYQSGSYTYTTTNSANCDSVVTLNLTIKQPTASTETVETCVSYTWNGTTYTQSGVYHANLTNVAGCDSTATLVLTINQPVRTTVSQTACDNYTWTNGNGQTYEQSGNYVNTIAEGAANGCDSIVTLSLTINPSYLVTEDPASTCDGSYTWNGVTYTQSGTYYYYGRTVDGCDSTAHITLTINQETEEDVYETACDSYTWENGDGVTYTESGTHTLIVTNDGCENTITLHLTINNSTTGIDEQTACDSYTWIDGETYTASTNEPTFTLTNVANCDSVVTLNLTINYSTTGSEDVEATGDSYVWHDVTYHASGSYEYHTTNAAGCDSTVTLNLTLTPAATTYIVTVVSGDETMGTVDPAGTFVVEEGERFTATATANEGYRFVRWNNGETTATINITVTENVTLVAIFTPVVGIDENEAAEVTIFSTDNKIVVRGVQNDNVYVYDVNGRVVYNKANVTDEVEFTMHNTGAYLVKVGNAPAKRVVVIR